MHCACSVSGTERVPSVDEAASPRLKDTALYQEALTTTHPVMARAGGPSTTVAAAIRKVVDGPDKPGHDGMSQAQRRLVLSETVLGAPRIPTAPRHSRSSLLICVHLRFPFLGVCAWERGKTPCTCQRRRRVRGGFGAGTRYGRSSAEYTSLTSAPRRVRARQDPMHLLACRPVCRPVTVHCAVYAMNPMHLLPGTFGGWRRRGFGESHRLLRDPERRAMRRSRDSPLTRSP